MRKFLKIAGWSLLVMVLCLAVLGIWKRDQIARLMAVNALFSPERIVNNFSHMNAVLFSREMSGGTPQPLPVGEAIELPVGTSDWIERADLTGLVIADRGVLVHESYHQGTGRDDLRISWSVAKSVLSMLLGILHEDGTIPDLNAQVTEYVPSLLGTAYDGATIRNVLNMASGVTFNEDYMDFWSDINRMGRVLAMGGTMDGFVEGLTERRGTPGADWQYVSTDTHVIGMVIRGATGQSIADLLETRLFNPLGLARDPYYITDGVGVEFVLGGLNLTTRDYARIGILVAQDGVWNGAQLVPAHWIDESTVPSAPGVTHYGYQWWIPTDAREGEVIARGVYGQFIYIDRPRDVVIAVNAADPEFLDDGVYADNIVMFRTLADQIVAARAEPNVEDTE